MKFNSLVRVGLVLSVALATTASYAAKKSKKRRRPANAEATRMEAPREARNTIGGSKNLVFHYSAANSLEYSAAQKARLNSDGAFGFGLKFQNIRKDQVGYLFGVHFELPRTFSSVSVGGSKTYLSENEKESVGLIYVDPSITYAMDERAYVFAGLNYAFPTSPKFAGVDVTGDVGYQYGAGYQWNRKVLLELMYRRFNFDLESGTTSINDAEMNGFQLQLTYAVE